MDDVITENELMTAADNEFKFSEDEIEEFRQIFQLHGGGGDFAGRIPLSEVTTMLKSIGVRVSEDELLLQAASNGSVDFAGNMNFDEFLQFLLDKRRLKDPDVDIRRAFQLFDKDADGYLTLTDLKQVMLNLGEHLTDDEVVEMIHAAGAQDDHKVNYDEFARIMSSV